MKNYPTERSFYDAVIKIDADLEGYFRIKQLYAKQELLIMGPSDIRVEVMAVLNKLNLGFIDENEHCLFLTNIPSEADAGDVTQAVHDYGISSVAHIDFFKLNGRGTRSAKVYMGNYLNTADGQQLITELTPTNYAIPFRVMHLPEPFCANLYARLWVVRNRARSQPPHPHRNFSENQQQPPTSANRNAHQRPPPSQPPPSYQNSHSNQNADFKLEKLIATNEDALLRAEQKHEAYLTQMKQLNRNMENVNVQLSQVVRRLTMMDSKLDILLPIALEDPSENLGPQGPPEPSHIPDPDAGSLAENLGPQGPPEATYYIEKIPDPDAGSKAENLGPQGPPEPAHYIEKISDPDAGSKRQHSVTVSPADLKRSRTIKLKSSTVELEKEQMNLQNNNVKNHVNKKEFFQNGQWKR
jgi:hypothetical protein